MKAPSGEWLSRQLRRAHAHAERVEPLLAAAVQDVLDDAAREAARRFEQLATATLTAAAPAPQSTMVCLYPTPEQAAAYAVDGGEDPSTLHVTLCYLGETVGPLSRVVDALRPVAARHAGLSGKVGGVGLFAPGDNGTPLVALPSVPGLVELRVDVTEALAGAGVEYSRDYGYLPHMTLAYLTQPDTFDVAGVAAFGRPLAFGSVWVIRGDVERVETPLAGRPPATAAAYPSYARLEATNDYTILPLDVDPSWAPSPIDEDLVERLQELRAAGRPPLPGDPWLDDIVERMTSKDGRTLFERIREVAEKVRPDGGYGDVWWQDGVPDGNGRRSYKGDGTVFWSCADWTSNEEVEAARAAFLAIDRVGYFDYTAEARPTPWVQVYGAPFQSMTAGGFWQSLRSAAEPHPPFIPPAVDEMLPADVVINQILARTRPTREAAVAAAMKPVLDAVGVSFDVTNPLIRPLLDATAVHVTDIDETTRREVARIVGRSYEEGLSIPHTAEAIRAGMTEANVARSRLIARTELVGAVNGASAAAVKIVQDVTGVRYVKRWMTAPGAGHPRHYLYDGLNGQQRRMSEKFDVGGYSLDHPGDPEGPAHEVCNCRCSMDYREGDPE